MSDEEIEKLAAQLYAIWQEAFGYNPAQINFEREKPDFRECWIQVAQFVAQREVPPMQVVVFNNTNLSEVDRVALIKQIRQMGVRDNGYSHSNEVPDHR